MSDVLEESPGDLCEVEIWPQFSLNKTSQRHLLFISLTIFAFKNNEANNSAPLSYLLIYLSFLAGCFFFPIYVFQLLHLKYFNEFSGKFS